MLEGLVRDFAFAWRALRRRPGFLFAAVATLALGIGATTAMFGIVDAVLLAPLPYADSGKLVAFHFTSRKEPGERSPLSVADWQDIAPQLTALAPAAVYVDNSFTLTGEGEAEQVRGIYGSGALFEALGVAPILGRTFVAADDVAGATTQVVLSYDFWQRRYGGAGDVLGKLIQLNDRPRTIVGVMPRGFEFPLREASGVPGAIAFWVRHPADAATRRGPYYLYGVGRLAPNTSFEQAQSQLSTIGDRLAHDHPENNADTAIASLPLKDQFVGSSRATLYALFCATALVLLIAAVNVSNLLLSRGVSRSRELAVRTAQGASAGHLLRQLLAEGALLAALGAGCGAALGAIALRFAVRLAPLGIPRLAAAAIDGRVLAFTVLVAAACAIGFGMLPARRATRIDTFDALRPSASSTASPESGRMRRVLVGVEIALCFVVLVATGLLLGSLARLQRVETGVAAPAQVLTAELALPGARYDSGAKTVALYEQVLERAAALPGVLSVGIGTSLPPNRLSITDSFTVEGQTPANGTAEPAVPLLFVDAGYFATLGIPLVRGRHFAKSDGPDAPKVALVNSTFAQRYFQGQDPIGKRLRIGGTERPESTWMEIVGIVGDVHYGGNAASVEPAYYVPFRQSDWSSAYLVVRTAGEPRAMLGPFKHVIAELDPGLALGDDRTLQERFDAAVGAPRFRSALFSTFGVLGLLLAAMGLYAVTATIVAERTREIGVRRALGASTSNVIAHVVGGAMSTAVAGLALGVIGALAATRLLQGLLFELSPFDPATYVGAGAILLATAGLAALVPARRAARADPMAALRSE